MYNNYNFKTYTSNNEREKQLQIKTFCGHVHDEGLRVYKLNLSTFVDTIYNTP